MHVLWAMFNHLQSLWWNTGLLSRWRWKRMPKWWVNMLQNCHWHPLCFQFIAFHQTASLASNPLLKLYFRDWHKVTKLPAFSLPNIQTFVAIFHRHSAFQRSVQMYVSATAIDCPSSSFRCHDQSQCLPGYEQCNSQIGCSDGSDEIECHGNPWRLNEDSYAPIDPTCPFRCRNGNCRALDVVCSGKDGCGDDSDEDQCQICSTYSLNEGLCSQLCAKFRVLLSECPPWWDRKCWE